MEADDVIQLFKDVKISEGLEAIDKVSDKKAMALGLCEFAGTLNYLKGQAALSEVLLKKAILLDRGLALAHYNLGVLYSSPDYLESDESGVEKAVMSYRRAVSSDPHLNEARYNLGLLYYFTGRVDGAKKQYDAIVADVGDIVRYRLLGALLLEDRRASEFS